MAVTAETRGGGPFRALLFLAVVSICGLTTARSVPEPGVLVAGPRYSHGATRELQGVYQLDACAWIQSGVNPGVGVCELNPQYGKLLLETTSHPLKEELFEEGECFTSGPEACENRPYCAWIPRTGTNPERCVYQKAPEAARVCTSEGLESFSGALAECHIHHVETCSRQPECTIVGEENELKRCGVHGPTALDLLMKSDMNQGALLKALIEGARALHWMDVPALVPEGFDTRGQVVGRRRLLQSATSTSFSFMMSGASEDESEDEDPVESSQHQSLFPSTPDSVSFAIVSSDDNVFSGNGGGLGIVPQEDNGHVSTSIQVAQVEQPQQAKSNMTDSSVPVHAPTRGGPAGPIAQMSSVTPPRAVPAKGETGPAHHSQGAPGAGSRSVHRSQSSAMSRSQAAPKMQAQTVSVEPSPTKRDPNTRPNVKPVPKGVVSVTTHTRPSPSAQLVPKGLVSTTAHTEPSTEVATVLLSGASNFSGIDASDDDEAPASVVQGPPSKTMPVKSGKQEVQRPAQWSVADVREENETDQEDIPSPVSPVRKGQMSVTAMTKMTGSTESTASEPTPVRRGMEAPPGLVQDEGQQVRTTKVALPIVKGENRTRGSPQTVRVLQPTQSGPRSKKEKTKEGLTTATPITSYTRAVTAGGDRSTAAGTTSPPLDTPDSDQPIGQVTSTPEAEDTVATAALDSGDATTNSNNASSSEDAAEDEPNLVSALDSDIPSEPSTSPSGGGVSRNDTQIEIMGLDNGIADQPSTEKGPINTTEGSRATTLGASDTSFHAASDDPKRLSADEDPSSNPVSISVGGGRTQNTVVAVLPFSDDSTSINPSPSSGLLTSGFGAFIASSNITGGLGSGFTGKSSDETSLGPTSPDSPSSEEAISLMAVLAALEDLAELMQVSSLAAAESGRATELVGRLARSLEKLRYGLDATYTETTFSLWTEVDAWWWRLQTSLQALAKESEPEPAIMAAAGCTLKEVAHGLGPQLESQGMANELHQLGNPRARFEEFATDCPHESQPLSQGDEEFGDLVSIVVNAVNESVSAIYPIRLDGAFAAEHNQSWVTVVAQRNQIWNDIRQNVSTVSLVGTFVQSAVRGMLLTLPFVEERLPEQLISQELASVDQTQANLRSHVEREPRLDDLLMLMDDFAGAMVAIFEGNYTLASVNTTDDTPGLEEWQLGPISADAVTDAVERAVNKTRFHPALLGNAQQLVLDGVVGIVLDAIDIMKAKVFPRAKQGLDLPPPPQGSMILNLLSSIETLMEGWMGFASARSSGTSHSTFGSDAAREATLDLAVCLALGGNSEESCSAVDLPFTGEGCVMREPPMAQHTPGGQKLPERLCMPQMTHQLLKIDEHLQPVPDEHRESLLAGMSDLLDAAAACAARELFRCEADKMCAAKNATKGVHTQTVCELASSFVNQLIEGMNVVGLVGKNKVCMKYLSRPKCTVLASFADCSAAEKCIWRPENLGIIGQAPRNASITQDGGQKQVDQSGKNLSLGENVAQQANTLFTAEKDPDAMDGPGYCVEDWVMQLEGVVEEAPERVLAMMDKHTECKDQLNAQRCGNVDAEPKIVDLFDATIPTGGSSMSKYIALSVSIGGTLLFVAILAVVWKVVKGRNRQGDGKLKKGDRKASGKSAHRVRPHCFPRFLRPSTGKGGKGKVDGQKRKKGEGKIPATGVRDWGQPSMIPPPAFVSTTIMISDPDGTPNVQNKVKNLSDFGFVLGTIEGSDSQHSGADMLPHGRRGRPGHITSEIEAACVAQRSDDLDSCSESAWSGSASSVWSDGEPDESEPAQGWYSLPASQRMQMK